MRERGEAEAGGVRVLLQSVAPSQSGSETLSWRGYGEDGCCVTLNTPTWTLSESLLYYTLFRRVHSDSTVLLSFVFFGTIGHCQSGILNRVHTCTYTHITQHLLYLLLRPKTLVPPPLSYTVYAHIHSQTHSQSCTEGNATPPPVHLSGRLSQLLIPSARAQTQTCREVSQRLHQKPLWKKPLNHEPRMFSCIYLFYNIVCIYVCVKIWYIY